MGTPLSPAFLTLGDYRERTIFFVENVKFQHTCIRSGYTVRIRYTGKIAGDKIHFTRRIGDCATGEPVVERVK